jgi:hypothetical protein
MTEDAQEPSPVYVLFSLWSASYSIKVQSQVHSLRGSLCMGMPTYLQITQPGRSTTFLYQFCLSISRIMEENVTCQIPQCGIYGSGESLNTIVINYLYNYVHVRRLHPLLSVFRLNRTRIFYSFFKYIYNKCIYVCFTP